MQDSLTACERCRWPIVAAVHGEVCGRHAGLGMLKILDHTRILCAGLSVTTCFMVAFQQVAGNIMLHPHCKRPPVLMHRMLPSVHELQELERLRLQKSERLRERLSPMQAHVWGPGWTSSRRATSATAARTPGSA